MIHKTMLALIFIFCIAQQSVGQGKDDLYAGWNHLFNIGISGNSNFSINPRIGQEGIVMQLGFDFEMNNINIDTEYIFENTLRLNFGVNKSSSNLVELEDGNDFITPFKKNYDFINLKTKYSKQINFTPNYIAVESYSSTQFLPSYTGNYIKPHRSDFELLSSFLSPLTSTLSIGVERRNDFDYVINFSPIASKIIYVNDIELAKKPAFNESGDTTIFLGSSLHGNELVYDEEQNVVRSFKKTRFFFGSQLTMEYNKEIIPDKLLLQSDSRFFYNYNGDKKHLDIQVRASVRFTVFAGLSLGVTAEYINDDNLFFQDLSQNQNVQNNPTALKRGASYNHRFVLNYTLSK